MLDRTPRVFISYSWTSTEFQQRVRELAESLRQDGIDVKLDIWDLKDGQDKYAFMEQCVTDPDIDKVLIICDSGYAAKADRRQGGVGDETTIISAEVYGHAAQEKFVPVIMERDEHGEPYMPAYLKSRMYRDLSGDRYPEEYQALVRNIYEKPSYRKPELGTRPGWLDEEESSELFSVKKAGKAAAGVKQNLLNPVTERDFIDVYLEALKSFYRPQVTAEEYMRDFGAMKEYRDAFLDYVKRISTTTEHIGTFLADAFEKMYNTLNNAETFSSEINGGGRRSFDIFCVHLWELFICTTAYLLQSEAYESLNELLVHTYFLRMSPHDSRVKPSSYERLRYRSEMLEDVIKPTLSDDLSRKYTLAGHYLCEQRDYLPVFTGKRIAEADLFLYQVFRGLDLGELGLQTYVWFPICYIYVDHYDSIWKKLQSGRFCEKIMPLFGVSTIEALKERLSRCISDREVRYNGNCWESASAILDIVKLDEVGRLP